MYGCKVCIRTCKDPQGATLLDDAGNADDAGSYDDADDCQDVDDVDVIDDGGDGGVG